MEVVKGRGYVYSIQYHIVWCVKYRRNILNGQVSTRLKELLIQISKDNGFQILEMNMNEDHIHMLINCTPQHYIPNIIKAMKGVSARLLRRLFFCPNIETRILVSMNAAVGKSRCKHLGLPRCSRKSQMTR